MFMCVRRSLPVYYRAREDQEVKLVSVHHTAPNALVGLKYDWELAMFIISEEVDVPSNTELTTHHLETYVHEDISLHLDKLGAA